MNKYISSIALVFAFVLTACQANSSKSGNIYAVDTNNNVTEDVYEQKGMEISSVAAAMGKVLYDTMKLNLDKNVNNGRYNRIDTKFPKIAITTFVDTDTFEGAGFLGRELSEVFVHEFNRRKIDVVEYKLTGNISVNKDGEYVFSRDFKKIAKTTMATHILAGTITRDKEGVILSARVINMQNHTVLGSATGFIPYTYLPNCYRSAQKNCSLSTYDIAGNEKLLQYEYQAKVLANKNAINQKRAKKGLGGVEVDASTKFDSHNDYVAYGTIVVPATTKGNYVQYLKEVESRNLIEEVFGRCFFHECNDPVIYEAQSYEHNGLLIRDIGTQSQYQRLEQY